MFDFSWLYVTFLMKIYNISHELGKTNLLEDLFKCITSFQKWFIHLWITAKLISAIFETLKTYFSNFFFYCVFEFFIGLAKATILTRRIIAVQKLFFLYLHKSGCFWRTYESIASIFLKRIMIFYVIAINDNFEQIDCDSF